MNLKQKIYEHCRELVSAKLRDQQAALKDLIDSAGNETKSSAGDKYETGRAMLHIEQDNVRQQIAELMNQMAVLDAIDAISSMPQTGLGSLVKANSNYYFLSVPLAKIRVEEKDVFALSLQSPLGAKLKGTKKGERFEMNGRVMEIEEVL
jgi:transcription elongation GreA/GreB family factor